MKNADRIREALARRPYWGPKKVAEATGIGYNVVRSTAAQEGIAFMDRYEVEAFVDRLVAKLESINVAPSDGQAE